MDLKGQKNLNWLEDESSVVIHPDNKLSKSEKENIFKKINQLMQIDDQQSEQIANLSQRLMHQAEVAKRALAENEQLEKSNLEFYEKVEVQIKSHEELECYLSSVETSYLEIIKNKDEALIALNKDITQANSKAASMLTQIQEQQNFYKEQENSLQENLHVAEEKIERLNTFANNQQTLEIVYREKIDQLLVQVAQLTAANLQSSARSRSEIVGLQAVVASLTIQQDSWEKRTLDLEILNSNLSGEKSELANQNRYQVENRWAEFSHLMSQLKNDMNTKISRVLSEKEIVENLLHGQNTEVYKLQAENQWLKTDLLGQNSSMNKLIETLAEVTENYLNNELELAQTWQQEVGQIKSEKESSEKKSDLLEIENRYLKSENQNLRNESQQKNEILKSSSESVAEVSQKYFQSITELNSSWQEKLAHVEIENEHVAIASNRLEIENRFLQIDNVKMQVHLDLVKAESFELKAKSTELLREMSQVTFQLEHLKGSSEQKKVMETFLLDLIQQLNQKIEKINYRSEVLKEFNSVATTPKHETLTSSTIVENWIKSRLD